MAKIELRLHRTIASSLSAMAVLLAALACAAKPAAHPAAQTERVVWIKRADGTLTPFTVLAGFGELGPARTGGITIPAWDRTGAPAPALPAGTQVRRADSSQMLGVLTMVRLSDGRVVPGVFRGPARLYERTSNGTGIIEDGIPRAWK